MEQDGIWQVAAEFKRALHSCCISGTMGVAQRGPPGTQGGHDRALEVIIYVLKALTASVVARARAKITKESANVFAMVLELIIIRRVLCGRIDYDRSNACTPFYA